MSDPPANPPPECLACNQLQALLPGTPVKCQTHPHCSASGPMHLPRPSLVATLPLFASLLPLCPSWFPFCFLSLSGILLRASTLAAPSDGNTLHQEPCCSKLGSSESPAPLFNTAPPSLIPANTIPFLPHLFQSAGHLLRYDIIFSLIFYLLSI